MDFRDAPRPRLFGHRGASGRWPENTLTSFREALREGATHLELDVHMSLDGEVIVLHDPTLDRTTSATGEARLRTYAELQAVDASPRHEGVNERIPKLSEVLEAFPGVPLNIEVKQAAPPMLDAFFEVVRRHGALDRVLVAAEDHDIMTAVRARKEGCLTGFSSREVLGFILEGSNAEYRPPGFALQVPEHFDSMPIVTPPFLERAKRLGVEVHVWTVNLLDDGRRLLEMGVDGLMSDLPGDLAPLFGSSRSGR